MSVSDRNIKKILKRLNYPIRIMFKFLPKNPYFIDMSPMMIHL